MAKLKVAEEAKRKAEAEAKQKADEEERKRKADEEDDVYTYTCQEHVFTVDTCQEQVFTEAMQRETNTWLKAEDFPDAQKKLDGCTNEPLAIARSKDGTVLPDNRYHHAPDAFPITIT